MEADTNLCLKRQCIAYFSFYEWKEIVLSTKKTPIFKIRLGSFLIVTFELLQILFSLLNLTWFRGCNGTKTNFLFVLG